MLNDFLTTLIYEMTRFVAKHPTFFEESAQKRTDSLEAVRLGKPFKQYLLEAKAEEFMQDLSLLLRFVNDSKAINVAENSLFKAILEFFTDTFSDKLDKLDADFYTMNAKEKKSFLEALIKSDTLLASALKNLLMNRSYQEIAGEISALSKRVMNKGILLVQMPIEAEAPLKKQIRESLQKEYPFSFPVFQINKQLIGGLRVFQDGKVADHSWLSRVNFFTSLK